MDVVATVRKLLARAARADGHEAVRAAERARHLMARHCVTHADVIESEVAILSADPRADYYRVELAAMVAASRGVAAMAAGLGIAFRGPRPAAESALAAYRAVQVEADRLAPLPEAWRGVAPLAAHETWPELYWLGVLTAARLKFPPLPGAPAAPPSGRPTVSAAGGLMAGAKTLNEKLSQLSATTVANMKAKAISAGQTETAKISVPQWAPPAPRGLREPTRILTTAIPADEWAGAGYFSGLWDDGTCRWEWQADLPWEERAMHDPWRPARAYAVGATVRRGRGVFVCDVAGVSGSGGWLYYTEPEPEPDFGGDDFAGPYEPPAPAPPPAPLPKKPVVEERVLSHRGLELDYDLSGG